MVAKSVACPSSYSSHFPLLTPRQRQCRDSRETNGYGARLGGRVLSLRHPLFSTSQCRLCTCTLPYEGLYSCRRIYVRVPSPECYISPISQFTFYVYRMSGQDQKQAFTSFFKHFQAFLALLALTDTVAHTLSLDSTPGDTNANCIGNNLLILVRRGACRSSSSEIRANLASSSHTLAYLLVQC